MPCRLPTALLFAPCLCVLIAGSLVADELHPIAAEVAKSLPDAEKPFLLVVQFTTKEGNADQLIEAFKTPVRLTRKEPGNLAYVLSQSSKQPQEFMMYERWQNLTALDSHLKQPYLTELLTSLNGLLAKPPELDVHLPAAEPK